MITKFALPLVLGVVTLDAIGIGLVMPVLPNLLRHLVHADAVAGHYGVLLAIYALMQFVCSPALGALSDRFGRRPVLLGSLAGASIDYAFMALAPDLWVLYVGRAIAGITGATAAVAGAAIADISPEETLARRFGLMSACFGLGLVGGPALGGLLGGYSPQAPFALAAVLNGLNGLLAALLLPETHRGERRPLTSAAFNPLASFRWVRGLSTVMALMAVFFVMQLVGQVPASIWVLFGESRFHWDTGTIGLSLAAFGILHAVAQGFVTGPLAQWLGESRAVLFGMAADALGYVLLAFASQSWMAFALMIPLSAGGVGAPALQAMLSREVGEARQGQLQGSLSALTSLTSIIGPLLFTAIYVASLPSWNGWAWLVGALLYLLCPPLLKRSVKNT